MLRLAQLILALLLPVILAGCADTQLTQDPRLVRILPPPDPEHPRDDPPAAPYAETALPYALLAEATYNNRLYPAKPGDPIPDPTAELSKGRCKQPCYADRRARAIYSQWRLVDAKRHPYSEGSGMDIQIWATRGRICRQVVIAFRGTDRGDPGDMLANFHWFGRIFGVNDEYKQLHTHIHALVDEAQHLGCYRKGTAEILAVGHSLGGGLAQHAGFYDHRIGRIFAFDPSFVTGSWDLPAAIRTTNSKGRKVERVYEHGEILAYPRYVLRHIVPPSAKDPRVELERFNVIKGNLIRQHRLAIFDTCLMEATAPELARGDLTVTAVTDIGGHRESDCQ